MRETDFINQNKDKWSEFESSLSKGKKDPDEMSKVFVEITDDLSFSRTHYGNRSVRVYLNSLAQCIYHQVYKSRRSNRKGFLNFWTHTVPEAMWHSRLALFISFAVFAATFALGYFSSSQDPDYVIAMMGQDYIDMTQENIDAGDPMAVYKSHEPLDMFLFIADNNIKVCFRVFISGIIAGIGTLVSLISEGARIGSFFQYFGGQDLIGEAFLAVMLHGTLELSMIILAGCAGLTLASGLLFPGVLTRFQSLIVSAKRALIIIISVSVLLLLAAFIESYVTRQTELPDLVRGSIIALSFLGILGYYVIYPWILAKKGRFESNNREELRTHRNTQVKWHEIKSSTAIFKEVFVLLGAHLKYFIYVSLSLAAVATIGAKIITGPMFEELGVPQNMEYFDLGIFLKELFWVWDDVALYFKLETYPALFFLYLLVFSAYMLAISYKLEQIRIQASNAWQFTKRNLPNALITAAITLSPLFLSGWSSLFLCCLIWPIAMLTYASSIHQGLFILSAFAKLGRLMRHRTLGVFSAAAMLILIPWMGLFGINSGVWYTIDWFISLNLNPNWDWSYSVPFFIHTVVAIFMLLFLFVQQVIGIHLYFFTANEINNAQSLKERVLDIQPRKQAYGLDKE